MYDEIGCHQEQLAARILASMRVSTWQHVALDSLSICYHEMKMVHEPASIMAWRIWHGAKCFIALNGGMSMMCGKLPPTNACRLIKHLVRRCRGLRHRDDAGKRRTIGDDGKATMAVR